MRKKDLMKYALTVFAGLLYGFSVYAQAVPDLVSLSALPASPSPNSIVTINANTPTLNKNALFFRWTVDGEYRPDLSGDGKNSIGLTVGEVGSVTRVRLDISGEGSGTDSLEIPVSDLALTWFAETYAPPWYKGKALPIPASVVSVVAVPQIILGRTSLKPEELIYKWALDDEGFIRSGKGEQVFRIKISDYPETTHTVSVSVTDAGGRVQKEGMVFITAVRPKGVIYSVSPLGGIETRSAKSYFATDKRGLFDFTIEPFFFPVSSRKALFYGWELNRNKVAGSPTNPYLLTVDTGKEAKGNVEITATIKGAGGFFSSVIKGLSLILQ